MNQATIRPIAPGQRPARSPFWPLAALVVLRRGGYRVPLISLRVSRAGTWVLVGLLSLGVLMNLASSSDWERFLQAPLAAVLAVLCLVVARGPS